MAGRGRRPLTLPPTKTPLLRPYPLLERSVGPKGGPLRQSVMLSGNIVNIVRGPGILVLYRRYGLPSTVYALALNKYWTLPRAIAPPNVSRVVSFVGETRDEGTLLGLT